jgi:hypothetical protein
VGLAKKSGGNRTAIIPARGAVPVETRSYCFLETDRLVSGTIYKFRTEVSGDTKAQ